jgi:hypothetical protein
MAEGNIRLGKVAFVDKGTYSAATTYNTFDFITTDDSCYLCIKDGNKGHALTETTWWKCIARGTTATAAAKKAEDAAKLANEKATAADSAAGKAVEATQQAKTATSNANLATQKANTAATNADNARKELEEIKSATESATANANAKANEAHEKAEEANTAKDNANEATGDARVVIARLEELEELLISKYKLIPTSMKLNYPKKVTYRNTQPFKVEVELLPVDTGRNVLFLGDDRAVSITPDGVFMINGVGMSKIHVIPTENTGIYQTIQIEVQEPGIRFTSGRGMRLSGSGGIILT